MEVITQEYKSFTPMVIRILGPESIHNGEGHKAYSQAVMSFKPHNGTKFSTWMYHNLKLQKLHKGKQRRGWPTPTQFTELDNIYGLNGGIDPAKIIEFRDTLNHLNKDVKTIIKYLYEQTNKKSRRTKYNDSSMSAPEQVKAQIQAYLRKDLCWTWPRIWKAMREVREFVTGKKDNRGRPRK